LRVRSLRPLPSALCPLEFRDRLSIRRLLGQRVELELDEQLLESAEIRLAHAELLEVERDRQIVADRDQLLGEPRVRALLEECFARPLLRNLGRVGEDLFQRAVAVHELRSRLVADAAHARHVVRRVADEREVVGHERRRYAESLAAVLDAHPLLFDRAGPAATGVEQPEPGSHELLEVLVARDDDDVHVLLDRLACQRADHVVRLVAGTGEDLNAVRVE
jgi:hypothetical protein